MAEYAAIRAVARGRVQGVYFRAFVQRHALSLGLIGYVRNLPGGRAVEVYAEGEKDKLENLLNLLHVGPEEASVEAVDTEWLEYTGSFDQFRVRY